MMRTITRLLTRQYLLGLLLGLASAASPLTAQTRLYLPSTGAAAVSPAFSAGWDDLPSPDRIAIAVASGGTTPQTVLSSIDANNTIDTDQLLRQYVSPPLNGAQTITGTLSSQVKAGETQNAQNARAQFTAYVVSNDGTTVRGVLFDFSTDPNSSEFSTSNVNRKFPHAPVWPGTLTSVAAQNCDRIVLEYGSRNHSTGVGVTIRLVFGDDGATDLASNNETSTATADPWAEFSQTLTFNAEGPCGAAPSRRVIVVGR